MITIFCVAGRPRRAGTRYSSANTYAATTRASRSVISSSYLEGMSGSPSSPNTGSLRNPADFHIKPLVGGRRLARDHARARKRAHVPRVERLAALRADERGLDDGATR